MAKIDAFFNLMNETGASDLHLVAGSQPILRVSGELERVKYDPLDGDELKAMLYEIAPEFKVKIFEETGDVDFGYEIPGVARYRSLRGRARRSRIHWNLRGSSEEKGSISPIRQVQSGTDTSSWPCSEFAGFRFSGLCPFDHPVHSS